MRNALRAALSGAVLAWAGVALAQHQGHQMGGSTGDGACVERARESLRIVEAANRRLEEARQTNSLPKMRAAIDDLQAALVGVKTQLSLCVTPARTPAAGTTSGMEGMDHSGMENMDHSKMHHEAGPAPSGTPTPAPKPH